MFLRWLRGNVGDIPTLEDLSKRRLMAYYDALATGGRHGRSRNLDTRRRMVQDVFQAWEWLDNQDEYEETVPRPRRFDMRRQPQSPTLAPTWAEMAACVGATQGWHRRVGLVLYYTGLRVGQVMQLRWSDFDLDHASGPLLTIRGELGKTKHERMGRVVPVSAHLVEELRTWERIEDWLIVSPRKRGGARERMFRARDMGRAWERAGVPQAFWKQRPDHAFRKGLISGLKREGADDEAVEQLVGHKQVGQRATYIDPDALPMREAVRLIPRVWDVPLATAGPLRAAGR
ncbi:MAG TPA: site-specific integrase [Myxococcota bacterium]|nr:site-specific integrase [Myxococcota bacterium]